MRLIAVDDNLEFLTVLTRVAQARGHDVTALSGHHAVAIIEAESPDAVLLDLRLGGKLDGRDILAQLRTTTPVYVVTGFADEYVLDLCLKLGARDVWEKSASLSFLIARVEHDARTAAGRGERVH